MVKKKLVAIVIPIYKSNMTELEKISYEQVKKILFNYDIYLFMPKDLIISNKIKKDDMRIVRFSDDYFDNIKCYNRLMLDKQFYERFQDYEYILIYQLDAFVFEDRLMEFCNMEYDYIGAPWLHGYFFYKDINHKIWNVGNGGFSLRRVESILHLLEKNENVLATGSTNEDIFFASSDGNDFRVAPQNIALQFSMEMNVKESINLNQGKLPFGCHAWQRYDLAYWKPFIEQYGYKIENVFLQNGYEDIKNKEWYEEQKKNTEFWNIEYNISMLESCLEKSFENPKKRYIIWGAGYWGRTICAMLKDAGRIVEAFIDRNSNLHDRDILGCRVISFQEFCCNYKSNNLIIALWSGYEEIIDKLQEKSLVRGKDFITFKELKVISEHIASFKKSN